MYVKGFWRQRGQYQQIVPPAIAFIISGTTVTSATYLIRVRLINK